MDYFPVFVKLKDQDCLVVGAGEIAARKIELLARAGARITVIAEKISPAVSSLEASCHLNLLQKSFIPADLRGFRLVVSATDNKETNQLVAKTAEEQNILVNVVDNPELCSFIFPAIIDRSPIIAAVSSGGAAPVLARLLRAKIESIIPPAYGQLARLAEKFRTVVKQHIKEPAQRRIFWENIFQGSVAELVFSGKKQEAERQLQQTLIKQKDSIGFGEVYLVGAGPGAPDLLTFRALRLMQQADVVVYDHLVSPEILDLARRDSEKIYVGKQREKHTLPQESINTLLADLAKAGKRVVRLKGGDPFIFGRGGEEIETLMQQGINFQVVPGITAASGCATYAGIPLTHRDHAQSCTFVTGHLKDNSINLNWTQLAAPNQTIVIYMGLVGLEKICQSLIAHGSPKNLPVALVQQGTTTHQRVITGTLETLPVIIAGLNIKPPTLIIIGTVVTLHDKLNWFQSSHAD
ncbi:MAG: siroheme synthase CysG [Methylococcaceae bacterium]|jgi:uroporphyrin-III C-methyltransferase/precorrin-2 dehydrogenase/sirohydrochlorin ferrochelatase|nr:siroheme synthase CysG [Methylococcaceae bacterium]MDD1642327.1 siroheme synthase CysG [Methylococcaceae bacterium]OYV18135.1 MAG: uroporphyrin-III C-methyltransferase / precorrin-2 dehydrogenase / sirohydrochlorin ferrochelatase [Methylococcaceae bacterium NSM2-1]